MGCWGLNLGQLYVRQVPSPLCYRSDPESPFKDGEAESWSTSTSCPLSGPSDGEPRLARTAQLQVVRLHRSPR